MSDDGFGPGVVMGILATALLFSFIIKETNDAWREQIVAHGCAGFWIDANNQRQWDWKPTTQPEPTQ
jgi:hypothetical protein